jgi:hypothetical protein
MPIDKRTTALPTHLSYVVYLHCLKHINKASSIKRKASGKSKVVPISVSCTKLANEKCKYCAHYNCKEVS